MFKNALVSTSNKDGLVDFLKPYAASGLRIVSTGGTAKYLRDEGFHVIDVSEQTEFPEVMDGRVKTLNPKIHMALLSRDGNSEDQKILNQHSIKPFDLVIVNLYPFAQAKLNGLKGDELIEFIDIGGPSMLRSAAKNFQRIAVICDPKDYNWINEKNELTIQDRKKLASKVFSLTSSYDSMIAQELMSESLGNDFYSLGGELVHELRYGENPQQKAAWYSISGSQNGLNKGEIVQGKALSYNNVLDLDSASSQLRCLTEKTACVAVKHTNPCGVAVGDNLLNVVNNCLNADPVSVFGGIIACNETIDKEVAERLSQLFLECIVAPSYSDEALKVFSSKKNLRVLKWPEVSTNLDQLQVRTVAGGFLIQNDFTVPKQFQSNWKILGLSPDENIKNDTLLAWQVCSHLKSNAISIVSNGMTVGLGMGQVNRIDAVKQAIERMNTFHPNVKEAVLASDAFFPFKDSIEIAAQNNIKWVIQPGGSIKDEEVFLAARELDVNLIITGERFFKH